MMILRLSREKLQKLKPKRMPIRSMLIDHKLLLQPKRKLRFSPFKESHKLKVNLQTLKPVERKRITKEVNVVEEAAEIEVAAAEVANSEIKQEKQVGEAEVVVLILDLVLLTRLMPRVALVLTNPLNPTNVIESQMRVKKAPNMKDLIKEMALVRLVVVEKNSRMVIANQSKVKKLKRNQKRRLRKKLLLKRKRRSLNLNTKKLLLVSTLMNILEALNLLEVKKRPELLRKSMLLLSKTRTKKSIKQLFKRTSI